MVIDYENITEDQVVEFVETIDWEKVPIDILFSKKVIVFFEDFKELRQVIARYIFSDKKDPVKFELLKTLIKERAFNINCDNEFLFRNACFEGCLDIAQTILKMGANVNALENMALKMSSISDKPDSIRFLLENGALIDLDFDRAMNWSINMDQIECVKVFLEYKKEFIIEPHTMQNLLFRERTEMLMFLIRHSKLKQLYIPINN